MIGYLLRERRSGGDCVVVRAAKCALIAAATAAFSGGSWAGEPDVTGKELYERHCVRCHGARGEGVPDKCADPLGGSQSLADLVQIVDETMPEDDPSQCTGEDARKVAQYIFESFYAPEAEERTRQARIELSRLTVRQYHNAVADLVGRFLRDGTLDERRGLRAEYFSGRGFQRDKRAIERVDGVVDFEFGEGSPNSAVIAPGEFSARWQGSVIADSTGDYEFSIQTENGARLWVNDLQQPLIDAWVQSGTDDDHRATIRLLGGRVYPLRLEFSRSKEKTASIHLRWQPPRDALAVIPRRHLVPDSFPPVFVVNTDFPPDDSSAGYERGTTISKSWDQAKTYAAVEIANKVVANIASLAGCKDDAPDRKERLVDFCHRFAQRAFRRPLSDEQKQFFVERHFEGEEELNVAVKNAVLLVLLSPRFLYLGIAGNQVDDYDIASRISFALWDSLPDSALLQAAERGELRTPDAVANQARRMLADPRARSKVRYFLHHWLNIAHVDDLSKDNTQFPGFDGAVAADLRESLDLFLDHIVWSDRADFRELLLADYWFVNRRLASFYGAEPPEDDGFVRVPRDSRQHAGLLTHPYLMARYAYHKTSSPIHRGVFIVRGQLGRFLKPPPEAVTPLDEGFNPDLTTRQRVALQTKPAACQTCHAMINPLGFAFEHFDAVGRVRTDEKKSPIDASGSYTTASGSVVTFAGARDLAEFLAASEETHRCFVGQLFHHVVKQPAAAFGKDELDHLTAAFVASEFNVQDLLVEIAKTTALQANDQESTIESQ